MVDYATINLITSTLSMNQSINLIADLLVYKERARTMEKKLLINKRMIVNVGVFFFSEKWEG